MPAVRPKFVRMLMIGLLCLMLLPVITSILAAMFR